MIKSVTVINHLNESIKIELGNPYSSGLNIKNITGIGGIQGDVNIVNNATGDGGVFNSSRVNARNITFDLAFIFGESIEEIRHRTYKYFPVKKKVKLIFETDIRTLEIEGYVESNEVDIFSQQQTSSISILCTNPYFYSPETHTTVFSGIEAAFEFPFSNESLSSNLLTISHLRIEQEQTVLYAGDAEVGIVIHIDAIGPVDDITIYNVRTRESMIIDSSRLLALTGAKIRSGDHITISTVQQNKFITLLRDGVETNILNVLGRGTDWFKIDKGDNIFVYTAGTEADNLQFRIENKIVYEGV